MMTILVAGGNSGIGLQAVRQLLAEGHRVVILGRDKHKGEQAIASFGEAAQRAEFFSIDLSTHAGVRKAAKQVLTKYDHLEAILHSTGILTLEDIRTEDGLNLFFAVNYLSRYHLTQLLLPALYRSERARVVMMTAKIDLSTRVDLEQFPDFRPFDFGRMREEIQIANHHYAAYLKQTESKLLAGVVNAGGANTGILRSMPWYMRMSAKVIVPLFFNSVKESAHNAVQACLRDDWPTATYWDKPGNFGKQTPIVLDEVITKKIMNISREITGI